MLVAVNEGTSGCYSRYMVISEIDREVLQRAREIFERYRKLEVFKECDFDDDVWLITNEVRKTRISFRYPELDYKKYACKWTGCKYGEYVLTAKVFITLQLGKLDIASLRSIANSFGKICGMSAEQVEEYKDYRVHIAEMIRLLPGTNEIRDQILETLDEYSTIFRSRYKKKPRELMDFGSYFRFADAITEYWSKAAEEEKLYYFPLYLWWTFTSILPLRPTEFLLMPRDCIRNDGDKDWITVRRTRIKGGNSRLSYKISGDYELCSYPVSDVLAYEILWYVQKTENWSPTVLDTLFRLPVSDGEQIQFLGYNVMCRLLKNFYQECSRLTHEENMINLGDTRHLAMMNLIISGGSPLVCKELARHESIDISSNYYANISTLVECAVFEQYRDMNEKGKARIIGDWKYQIIPETGMVEVPDGWCCSPEYAKDSIDDCVSAVSPDSEIGDCHYCKYYRTDTNGPGLYIGDIEANKTRVKADSWYLMHMMETVRCGIGYEEDISRALLRLQHSCKIYKDSLTSGMEDWNATVKKIRIRGNDSNS